MKIKTVLCYALAIGAVAVVAACGALPQPFDLARRDSVANDALARSGVQAKTSTQDLMYVIMGRASVYIFSYPEGDLVGRLSGLTQEPTGLCSDEAGDVFVTGSNQVLEYAHGGTSPIKTLTASGRYCAGDPSSGDLAVSGGGGVQIFRNASGTPHIYTNSEVGGSCTYDNAGNLFIDGRNSTSQPVLSKFANKRFTTIALSARLYYMDDLQWDGKYVVIDDFTYSATLYRVRVYGSTGMVESATALNAGRGGLFYGDQAWLQGKTFISSILKYGRHRHIFYWSYPKGGRPIQQFIPKAPGPIGAITISAAPTQSRIRN